MTQLTWSNGVEGSVYVHGVGVLECENVESVVAAQVSAHPFYSEVVGHLTPLNEDIFSAAHKVSSVESGFELGGDELPFESQLVSLLHTLDRIAVVVEIFAQNRFGARAPLRA